MKNTLYLFVFFLILFSGCKSSQEISEQKDQQSGRDLLDIVVDNNEIISFQLINNSSRTIKIQMPEKLYIEKFNNGNWNKLRILPCPCDAPCARMEEQIEIPATEKHVLSWDKNESWCGSRNEKGIRETLIKKVESGRYRIRINFKNEGGKTSVLYKEFQI